MKLDRLGLGTGSDSNPEKSADGRAVTSKCALLTLGRMSQMPIFWRRSPAPPSGDAMKRDPSELAWRVVRYRRSGIYRAQRLPRDAWRSMPREEAVALAAKRNEEGIAWRRKALERIAREHTVLTIHVLNGDRRPR